MNVTELSDEKLFEKAHELREALLPIYAELLARGYKSETDDGAPVYYPSVIRWYKKVYV